MRRCLIVLPDPLCFRSQSRRARVERRLAQATLVLAPPALFFALSAVFLSPPSLLVRDDEPSFRGADLRFPLAVASRPSHEFLDRCGELPLAGVEFSFQ